MKKVQRVFFIITIVLFVGCEKDSFLDKYPLTGVSPETYFKSGNDFKVYVNQFYDLLGDWTGYSYGPYDDDLGTDNQIEKEPNRHLNGETVVEVDDDNWTNGYSNIRAINLMLTAELKDLNLTDINPYLGEGHFFRAWIYFNLLRRFGGVPFINTPLDPNSENELATPRSTRNAIADSIIADLNIAIEYLPEKSEAEKFRLFKEVALAFKSRVCLYEGTWEKYHGKDGDPFSVAGSDGSIYLQQAMDAASQIINTGLFSIETIGDEPYYNLFNREDYSNSEEIMLWRKSNRELRAQNVSQMITDNNRGIGLTKNLIESYLCIDGQPSGLTTLTIADDSLTVLIKNRDPRLAQTIFYPGIPTLIEDGTNEVLDVFEFVNLSSCMTGYHFRKGGSVLKSNYYANLDQIAYIYFRYAEVLLNYIEAKAELNEMGKATLTQNDFDISINKIRDRINMPHLNYTSNIVDPNNPFTGEIPWYLVEIRRERRIELALEGFRVDDIFRWAAADKLIKGKIFKGAKYQWYVDRGWYETDQIKQVDNEGLLSPWYNTAIDQQGGYDFNLNRDYLYPIPSQEIALVKYKQNPGWE